jgi:membrane-bound ClpP family serine protease
MGNANDEASKHGRGCLFLVLGLGLIVLACAMGGGTGAVIVGMIGLVCFFIGFFPAINNRSASKIADDKASAQAIASMWGAKVKAGESITSKDVDKAISDLGMDGVQKHEQAKKDAAKIVKGAVVGGIIAGEPGAVVGAVVAKNEIDKEKENK